MKTNHLIIAGSVLLNAVLGIYYLQHKDDITVNLKTQEVYRVDGDEAPGIGADSTKPDEALVWIGADKELHIRYAAEELTGFVTLSDELDRLLSEDGEVHASMAMYKKGNEITAEIEEQ